MTNFVSLKKYPLKGDTRNINGKRSPGSFTNDPLILGYLLMLTFLSRKVVKKMLLLNAIESNVPFRALERLRKSGRLMLPFFGRTTSSMSLTEI